MKRSVILAAAALILFNGCTMVNDSMRTIEKNSIWNPVESVADKKKKKSTEEALPPETMAAIWNFGVYEKPGSPSTRGLSGRLYFYDAKNKPVKVDGELIVYGFDEDSGTKTRPDKKFVFRASELQSHYSESAFGGSYSVWIPWDKAGGYRKSVTLLPMFKGTDGQVIQAEQSINLLAGRSKKAEDIDANHPYKVLGSSSAVLGQPSDQNPVKQASFSEADGDTGQQKSQIRTTAISLTPNLQRQVELAGQIRNGKKPFSQNPPQASTIAPAPAQSRSTEPTSSQPVTRTSTTKGVFGAPGAIR